MARSRKYGSWFSRKKTTRTAAKNKRAGRTKGEFATLESGRQVFVPDRHARPTKDFARYCTVPIRGWSRGFVAVIDKRSKRAIGFNTESNILVATGIDPCGADFQGARKRRRR